MNTLLIAGSDCTVGANIALTLSDKYNVVAVSFSQPQDLDGCQNETLARPTNSSVQQLIDEHQPDWILHCGVAGEWTWDQSGDIASATLIDEVRWWSQICEKEDIDFTLMSSDAVFTGPWMFHEEDSDGQCDSQHAQTIRAIEREARAWNPDTLVVRTTAFGWTPESLGEGCIEQIQQLFESGQIHKLHSMRHATPILATELAEIVVKAVEEGLTGIYHVAGAERINPVQFGRRFSELFDMTWPISVAASQFDNGSRSNTYGNGETSLLTKKIRMALCLPMPTITESLTRLREQQFNGFRDRLNAGATNVHRKVA